MAEELTKEEKARIKEERRKAFRTRCETDGSRSKEERCQEKS